jgi:hypothetical protein
MHRDTVNHSPDSPARERGGGTARCAVGGALAATKLFDERHASNPTPPPPRFAWSPSRACAGADRRNHSRDAVCIRVMIKNGTTSMPRTDGRRSADRRIDVRLPLPEAKPGRSRGPADRSPCGAPPRRSPKPRGLGSVRSRASWQRTNDPLPGQPAPGGPASWPAGRVSEPPERGVRNRARAPRSLHRQDRIRTVPFDERAEVF